MTLIVRIDDPGADPAEVAYLHQEREAVSAMLPLVAKGRSIGLVELMSRTDVVLDQPALELASTMANEAAMALENALHYQDARELADRDQLTGFFNHRYLHQRLGEEIVRAQRSKSQLALLMIDLDDFKLVNDTFGHLFGDRVLAWGAEQIRSTLRGKRRGRPLWRRRVRDHPAGHRPGGRATRLTGSWPPSASVPSRARIAARSRSVRRSAWRPSRPTAGPAASSSRPPTSRCTG